MIHRSRTNPQSKCSRPIWLSLGHDRIRTNYPVSKILARAVWQVVCPADFYASEEIKDSRLHRHHKGNNGHLRRKSCHAEDGKKKSMRDRSHSENDQTYLWHMQCKCDVKIPTVDCLRLHIHLRRIYCRNYAVAQHQLQDQDRSCARTSHRLPSDRLWLTYVARMT